MASWIPYKGLEVPDTTSGDAGTRLKNDLKILADRAPFNYAGDPTVGDDSGDDFFVGSHWFNTLTQTMWVCTSAASGAAKWRSLYRRVENAIVIAPVADVGGGSTARALQLDDSGNLRGTNAVDLQRTRWANSQVAAGANAALLGGERNTAFSSGSVVAGGLGNNAGGGSGTITGVATGNPATITSNGHGLVSGQTITISGCTTSASINGNRVVTVTTSNAFTVPVNVSSVSDGTGDWTTSATAAYAFVAGGFFNNALGKHSHAEGRAANAIGAESHAEGYGTTARGKGSHAEGGGSIANGYYAHAEGVQGIANGDYSHAEGSYCVASVNNCHAEGNHTTASGDYSHSEGFYTLASGIYAHAEGIVTQANGQSSHAEGDGTQANGDNAHAEGDYTQANGATSHAEGTLSQATGTSSHAGGIRSKAHLSAQWARASGGHSSALGTAQSTITHLFGRTTDGTTATELTIGGGSPSSLTRFTIRDGQTLSCFINIVGRKENGGANDHASFLRQVCIRRESSTTALVDTVQTIGGNINPASWSGVSITADDTNESLKIAVTGLASTDIRWMATVFASEVADAAI